MKTAQRKILLLLFLAVSALFAALVTPIARAASGGPQECTVGASCVIGEFVYDDSYLPVTGATCTVTSRYPDGSLFLNSQPATGNSDGWYAYSFSTPSTTGYYRTQICCTVGSEYFCLDKSFESKVAASSSSSSSPSANEISDAVWNHSSRTLSSFGTLVRDIWLNANRTLTSSVLTSSRNDDLSVIKKTVQENRILLEKLVNKPIIENFLEEDKVDLSEKIDRTRTTLSIVYANSEYLRSRVSYIVQNWNRLTHSELKGSVSDMESVLGRSDSFESNTLAGGVNWLKKSWDWEPASTILEKVVKLERDLANISSNIDSRGRSASTYKEVKGLTTVFNDIESLIGKNIEEPSEKTLYGKLKEVIALKDSLESRMADIDSVLTNWSGQSQNSKEVKINDLTKKLLAVNNLRGLRGLLVAIPEGSLKDKDLKNRFLQARGVVSANLKYLAHDAGKPFSNIWLELGSIVFKSVITNPSSMISQEVPLKYYLPPEIKEEHIISKDDRLKIGYDSEKGQYYVEGEFTLKPNESKTISVSVQDIWEISQEDIESLRRQAEELSKPLEKTSFFAQGVTLKSNINVSLDKIVSLQKSAITPEAKIRAYREAQIEMLAVLEKIDKLQELVTQAGSAGAFFGFIGGAQTLAVWGLIIIMAAGFVFLALYMRVIRKSEDKEVAPLPKIHKLTHQGKKVSHIKHALALLIYGAVISGATAAIVLNMTKVSEKKVLGDDDVNEEKVVKELDVSSKNQDELEAKGGEEVVLINPVSGGVSVYAKPESSEILTIVEKPLEVVNLDKENGWVKVAIKEKNIEGWVQEKFIRSEDEAKEVLILETPTGFLRVRKKPHGEVIGVVDPGMRFEYLGSKDGWIEIKLDDGSGWVSADYIEIN